MQDTIHCLAYMAVTNGGFIKPLLISSKDIVGPSLMNPSILDINNQLYINLRNVNYVLYHSEHRKNEHIWGPLCYLHTEQNPVLATHNILCLLDHNYDICQHSTIDTTKLDQPPLWEFIGLEDIRLSYWDNKLYCNGVRRDTTTNGQGRIELSEIQIANQSYIEVSRQRIPAPPPDNSYCEKNWMPILDMPYTYVKWTNPTEVVKYDIQNHSTQTIILKNYIEYGTRDLRGGSQVIPYKQGYLAVVHEVDLFQTETGKKNAVYTHRIVFWNKDFHLISVSPVFNFMGGHIEFACGACFYNNQLLITFGFQDNAAYLLGIPETLINELLYI